MQSKRQWAEILWITILQNYLPSWAEKSLLSNSNGVYITLRMHIHSITHFFRVIDTGAQILCPIGAKICVGLRQWGGWEMRRPRNEEALLRRRGQSQFTIGDKGTWDCSPADHFVQPFLFRDEAHERLAQDCTGTDINSSWSNSFDNFLLTNSTLFGNPPTTDQGNYFPLLTILLPQDILEKNIKERQLYDIILMRSW